MVYMFAWWTCHREHFSFGDSNYFHFYYFCIIHCLCLRFTTNVAILPFVFSTEAWVSEAELCNITKADFDFEPVILICIFWEDFFLVLVVWT